eukprot:12930926-Alexandrium_andersonii.AAC.1
MVLGTRPPGRVRSGAWRRAALARSLPPGLLFRGLRGARSGNSFVYGADAWRALRCGCPEPP